MGQAARRRAARSIKTCWRSTRLGRQKLRERNEALDCRTYARAALWILGADRWSEDQWRRLEDEAESRRRAAAGLPSKVEPSPPFRPKIIRSPYMDDSPSPYVSGPRSPYTDR